MNRVVALTRAWIGTPYVHGASMRGAGCDCLGLVRGIWRDLHPDARLTVPAYGPDWAEAGAPDLLLAGLRRHLVQARGPMEPGQVLVFRLGSGGAAKHLGVLTGLAPAGAFVHAYARHGVVESPLSAPWARRIAARFWLQERAD